MPRREERASLEPAQMIAGLVGPRAVGAAIGARGWTWTDLARESGVALVTLMCWKGGRQPKLGLRTIEKIMSVLPEVVYDADLRDFRLRRGDEVPARPLEPSGAAVAGR